MVLSSLVQLYGSYFGHAQLNICLVVEVVVVTVAADLGG